MLPATTVQGTASCGAGDEAELNEEGLDDIFDRVAGLAEAGRERFHPDRATAVKIGDHGQVAPVHGVEAEAIDLQTVERAVGDHRVNRVAARCVGEIADPTEKPAGNTRGAA